MIYTYIKKHKDREQLIPFSVFAFYKREIMKKANLYIFKEEEKTIYQVTLYAFYKT